MAIETDRPFYESFDNGVGMLNHTWADNIDRSVSGEIKLTGYSGTMEFPSGISAGHGYGTYTANAKIDGNQPGPAILLWPGNDRWPGQEIDLVEMLPGGLQYGTVHWDDNGNSYTARMFEGVSSGQFHDYTVVWEPGRITFKVDGAEKGVVTNNVPADYDNGGMNNVIGVMNTNDSTSLTVRSVQYQPLGGDDAPAPSQPALSGGGSFSAPPPADASTTIGFGPDTLTLRISQDSYQGSAQYVVLVDGTQIGGTQTAQASHGGGQSDSVMVRGDWSQGNHTASVSFLNDAYDGTSSTDRNLYVDGAVYNDADVGGAARSLFSAGTTSFGFFDPLV